MSARLPLSGNSSGFSATGGGSGAIGFGGGGAAFVSGASTGSSLIPKASAIALEMRGFALPGGAAFSTLRGGASKSFSSGKSVPGRQFWHLAQGQARALLRHLAAEVLPRFDARAARRDAAPRALAHLRVVRRQAARRAPPLDALEAKFEALLRPLVRRYLADADTAL